MSDLLLCWDQACGLGCLVLVAYLSVGVQSRVVRHSTGDGRINGLHSATSYIGYDGGQ